MSIKTIDLHIHSNASDGTFTPAEIVRHAVSINLEAIALTDHDTISGLDEFLQTAATENITAIPGVEISSLFSGREIHILGYFIDYHNPALLAFLDHIRAGRNSRNEDIIRRLQSLGYEITLEEVTARAGGESIGRPHVASLLIEKGYFKDSQQAFERCLKRGAPAFCPRKLPHPEEAIRIIHQAGGIAVWAHPVYRNKFARSHVRGMLRKMKPLGLDGVEGFYPGYTPVQHQMLLELAAISDLVVSGGTDFHGGNIPSIAMGSGDGNFSVPAECLAAMREYHHNIKHEIDNITVTGE